MAATFEPVRVVTARQADDEAALEEFREKVATSLATMRLARWSTRRPLA